MHLDRITLGIEVSAKHTNSVKNDDYEKTLLQPLKGFIAWN